MSKPCGCGDKNMSDKSNQTTIKQIEAKDKNNSQINNLINAYLNTMFRYYFMRDDAIIVQLEQAHKAIVDFITKNKPDIRRVE